MSSATVLEHGGPDDGPPIRHDFSSNASCLPTPGELLQAVLAAPRAAYPDPGYRHLRARWAAALDQAPETLLPSAGGAEAIRRLTLLAKLRGLRHVWVPLPGFGEYAAAAEALGLQVHGYEDAYDLMMGLCAQEDGIPTQSPAWVWVCDPSSPSGAPWDAADWQNLADALGNSESELAIDLAYAPLLLDGQSELPPALAAKAWLLHCPNKALALTGVRAGMIQAPAGEVELAARCEQLAPSWVLSAEGVAMLSHWHDAGTQEALQAQRQQLLRWRHEQHAALRALGWQDRPSACPFALWRPGASVNIPTLLHALRQQGIKLRDTSSMGAPGQLRLSVQSPEAQAALIRAMEHIV